MRQETGRAFVFPGPMWLPLYLLSAHAMDSLSHLQIKVPPFSMFTDLRSYHTLFQQTAAFTIKVRETLESLVVVFGESQSLFEGLTPELCGTGRAYRAGYYRPWCVKMAKVFLKQQLAALNENAFLRLKTIRFEGFRLLKDADPREAAKAELTGTFDSIGDCRFTDATFIEISSVQRRQSYHGHNRGTERICKFDELLASS